MTYEQDRLTQFTREYTQKLDDTAIQAATTAIDLWEIIMGMPADGSKSLLAKGSQSAKAFVVEMAELANQIWDEYTPEPTHIDFKSTYLVHVAAVTAKTLPTTRLNLDVVPMLQAMVHDRPNDQTISTKEYQVPQNTDCDDWNEDARYFPERQQIIKNGSMINQEEEAAQQSTARTGKT